MTPIPLVDLFAGPGGLNEGFCSVERTDGAPVFATAASIEMDAVACETLRVRSAVRALRGSERAFERYRNFLSDDKQAWADFADDAEVQSAFRSSRAHVHQLELGPANRAEASTIIRRALDSAGASNGPWVLIGGPPCQAYSLVGRARRKNDAAFEDDVKHFLYREYLDIIAAHNPPLFVMENVKGLLSHTHRGESLFTKILEDLATAGPGYDIRSFVVNDSRGTISGTDLAPSDYVIRAEEYGVPQKRHRVILLGVRSDLAGTPSKVLTPVSGPTVREVIGHLPHIRSLISPRRDDDAMRWRKYRSDALRMARYAAGPNEVLTEGWRRGGPGFIGPDLQLEAWLTRAGLRTTVQHVARAHMPEDLKRYAYLAAKAEQEPDVFIRIGQLPKRLLPNHANALRADAPFSDRFRVQTWDRHSSTVTSHIAKDGHYYIHPDPHQMRSLTVREAARLQTFPDDYLFWGNRTQQYHQVGNAVPPYLARQLAQVVAELLGVAER